MKNRSLVVAWMLVGAVFFSFASPEIAAEDATQLPSVMVPPGSGASGSANAAPAGAAPVDPFMQTPGGAASPAPGASEAPRWTPPGANPVPEANVAPGQGDLRSGQSAGSGDARTTGVTPPQALPDVGDAKPLVQHNDGVAAPGRNSVTAVNPLEPATSDGKLKLPAPPGMEMEGEGYRGAPLPDRRGSPGVDGRGSVGMEPQGSGVNPAQYQWELPPGNPQLKDAPPARLAPANLPPPTSPPSVDPAIEAAAHAAADLWKSSLHSKHAAEVAPLRQFLERSSEAQRPAVAQGYWRLMRAAANQGWALDEQKRLEQTVPSRNPADTPMLSAARAAAAARATNAELEFGDAWNALESISANFGNLRSENRSFLVFDNPLVGPYHTFYAQIFAGRPNQRGKQLDRSLTARQRAINDWVATVHSATSAVHYAEQAHAQGTVDLRTVLACHDAVREHRRKFLDAVYHYNCEIAEYAALAAPAGTSAEKFTGMLIPAKPPERLSSAPARPALPQGAGGLRQLPAGQQGTGAQTQTGDRRLPWGDGWMPSSQSQQLQQAPPQRLPPPAGPSYGATGDWQNSGTGGQGNSGAVAPPNAGTNSNRQADPFADPRYGTPGR